MKKSTLFLLCFFLAGAAAAWAVPDCYTNAKIPAHEFPFHSAKEDFFITALEASGEECREVKIHNGAPILAQKIYAPMRQVYEAYARAIEKGDVEAAKSIYTWLKPTPRQFPLWLWLANEPEGAPMPWGMDMALKILRLLQPHASIEDEVIMRGDQDIPVLDMRKAWPMLYLLMGGQVLPQANPEEWTASSLSERAINRLLLWQSPWAALESARGSNNALLLRLP